MTEQSHERTGAPIRAYVLVAILYAGQGLPLSFLFVVLPLALNNLGLEESAIGAYIGMCMLPWILKPLWGIAVDRWPRRTVWIVLGQSFAVVSLAVGAVVSATMPASGLMIGAIAGGLGCAVQDVATDGFAIARFPRERRGAVNAAMAIGMTAGSAIGMSAGATVYGLFGVPLALTALSASTLVLTLAVASLAAGLRAPIVGAQSPISIRVLARSLVAHRSFHHGWVTMALIAATGISGALIPLFFETKCGMTEEQVGVFMTSVGIPAVFIGNLLGLRLIDRIGRRIAAIGAIIAIALVNGGMGVALLFGASPGLLGAGAYYLSVQIVEAFGAAAVLGLLMDCCIARFGGVQFATIMALGQLGGAISAWVGGVLLDATGWSVLLLLQGVLCVIPLLCVIALLRPRRGAPSDPSLEYEAAYVPAVVMPLSGEANVFCAGDSRSGMSDD
ncbi:MAG: MFS transporter [Phycisphaeraceae bacterium]|nr:MFS transporter [Phycisphaeraceae bacterium]